MHSSDYQDHSLEQLRQAYRELDAQAHPKQAAFLAELIKARDEAEVDAINDIEHPPLARRRERFAAFLIDSVIGILASLPLMIVWSNYLATSTWWSALGLVLAYQAIMFALIHGYYLATRAQTVGKYFLNICIETLDGRPATFSRCYLARYLPVLLAYNLPFLGALLALADIMFIFRGDRRCVHDHIAGTLVGYHPAPRS